MAALLGVIGDFGCRPPGQLQCFFKGEVAGYSFLLEAEKLKYVRHTAHITLLI